jgi:hypothetical protein
MYELGSLGRQDLTLMSPTLDHDVQTLFRQLITRHTAFVRDTVELRPSAGSVRFGAKNVEFKAPKHRDLLTNLYARISVPGISGAYVYGFAEHVLEKVSMLFGSHEVTYLTNLSMHVWEEVAGKPGRSADPMLGKFGDLERGPRSSHSQTFNVQLPFYFTADSGVALPLVSMHQGGVSFKIDFAPLSTCHIGALPFVVLDTGDATTTHLSDSDLNVVLDAHTVALEEEERSRFAMGQFEQLMTCWQHLTRYVSHSGPSDADSPSVTAEHNLNGFGWNTKEIFMTVRRQDNISAKKPFNFTGFGHHGAVRWATVKFCNNDRVQRRQGSYYHHQTNHDAHSNVPRDFIYNLITFSMDPEDTDSSGSANLSRIDEKDVILELDPRCFSAGNTQLVCDYMAPYYNILRLTVGAPQVRFH